MQITDIRSRLPRKGTQDTAHPIGSVTHIIVHHDAQTRPVAYDSVTRYVQQANYHISRGEDGLQYHYKIDNVGEIFQCRTLTDTLWHCGNYPINRASIAICLDGYLQTNQKPTREQYKALKELLDWLCTQHPEFPADQNDVFGHGEVGSSACPGNNLLPWVQKYRATNGNVEIPAVPYNDGTMGTTPPPPVPQTPTVPVGTLYRVFDANGTQVGAYSSLANAKTKLATLTAGVIKDQTGKVVEEKKIVPVADVPPFKEPQVEPPVVTEPPVVEPPVVEPPVVEPPVEPEKGFWYQILEAIVNFLKGLLK